ncbi:MAG: hypothetical protein AAGI11_16490 [Pseudomonadota bacterium]
MRAIVIAACFMSSGCFIKVSAIANGDVYSNLGADCEIGCPYNLDVGDRFRRTFTAEPYEGAEFIRWEDDLGDNLVGCNSPINAVCRIEIDGVHPALAEQGMQVDARFAIITGYNLSRFSYDSEQYGAGVFRQIDAERWIEEHEDGRTASYLLTGRGDTGVSFTDERGEGLFTIDLSNQQINTSILSRAAENTLAVDEANIRPSGELVTRVEFGNALGLLQGYYQRQDSGFWEMRDYAGKLQPMTLYVSANTDESIELKPLRGDTVHIDLETGEIDQRRDTGERFTIGYVHRLIIPVTGWNVIQASFGDRETGEPVGSFRRQPGSGSVWFQYREGSDVLVARLEEQDRSGDRVTIFDQGTGNRYILDLKNSTVGVAAGGSAFSVEQWQILEID